MGGYDVGSAANFGRNYWSFDTVGAITWINAKIGTEVSIVPGFFWTPEFAGGTRHDAKTKSLSGQ